MIHRLIILLMAPLLFCACATSGLREFKDDPQTIEIRVVDLEGEPLSNCLLLAVYPISTDKVEAKTDENGLARIVLSEWGPMRINFAIFYKHQVRGAVVIDLPEHSVPITAEAQIGYYVEYNDDGLLRIKTLDESFLVDKGQR